MGVARHLRHFCRHLFWFPKMFGRFLNERIGKVHFWLTFIGVYSIFMPMPFWASPAIPPLRRPYRRSILERLIPVSRSFPSPRL